MAFFIREMIESYPAMHSQLLEQLRDSFAQLQSTRVCTTVLWILAEYSKEVADIHAAMDVILASLGPPPFIKGETGADFALSQARVLGLSSARTAGCGCAAGAASCEQYNRSQAF